MRIKEDWVLFKNLVVKTAQKVCCITSDKRNKREKSGGYDKYCEQEK